MVRSVSDRVFSVAVLLALAVLAVIVAPAARGDSTVCDNVFVGDLNNDKKVTVADITVFQQLRSSGGYSPCADFTRDGILNDADGTCWPRWLTSRRAPSMVVASSAFRTSR